MTAHSAGPWAVWLDGRIHTLANSLPAYLAAAGLRAWPRPTTWPAAQRDLARQTLDKLAEVADLIADTATDFARDRPSAQLAPAAQRYGHLNYAAPLYLLGLVRGDLHRILDHLTAPLPDPPPPTEFIVRLQRLVDQLRLALAKLDELQARWAALPIDTDP